MVSCGATHRENNRPLQVRPRLALHRDKLFSVRAYSQERLIARTHAPARQSRPKAVPLRFPRLTGEILHFSSSDKSPSVRASIGPKRAVHSGNCWLAGSLAFSASRNLSVAPRQSGEREREHVLPLPLVFRALFLLPIVLIRSGIVKRLVRAGDR